jgi:hypothetical protein
VNLELRAEADEDQLPDWREPLQILSSIPGVQLAVEWVGSIDDVNHPFITQWLKQHGQRFSHIDVEVDVSKERLKLRDFAAAAAPCRSIDLMISHTPWQVVEVSDLDLVAGSLQSLYLENSCEDYGSGLIGANRFNNMSQLTALHLNWEGLRIEEPWGLLADMTNLQQLSLDVQASGDPSPLSALTGLQSLSHNSSYQADDSASFSFSSLQPLSTLRQLEDLHLLGRACAATSLQGLAVLSNLTSLHICSIGHGGKLRSLEGISPGLVDLFLRVAPDLVSLAGIECCTSMETLTLNQCGVNLLQPLRGLSSLQELNVHECCLTNLVGLKSVSLQSLCLERCYSLTHLSGVEHLSALTCLKVEACAVTSLQPLSELGEGLQKLRVWWCNQVRESVLELPHVQPTVDLDAENRILYRVVLAGGVEMECIRDFFGYRWVARG